MTSSPLKTYTPAQKEAARRLLSILESEASLYEFLKQMWPYLGAGQDFVEGWHIQAIAEHLEACYRREIKRLIINVPPRSCKTSLISIAFPAWVWVHNPSEKFMYASYGASLALEHSLNCRRIIESPWYQSRWGDMVKLTPDQNAKSYFENTAGGYRIATSIGGAATGLGGNILVWDDPNNAKDGESEAKRESTNGFLSRVWPTRLNNPKNDVMIGVQQRLDTRDATGYTLANDDNGEWVHLVLPMEFEGARRAKTVVLPSTDGKMWQDPRQKEGELLCPERFSEKEINQFKIALGSYGYAGQFQQLPSPAEGGIIKKTWFKWWKHAAPPTCAHVIQSWDTALESGDKNSYSACTTWGVFEYNNAMNVILLSLWRGKEEFPELRKRAQRLYNDYRDTGEEDFKGDGRHIPDVVLIEAKVSGVSLIQEMMRAGINAFRFNPNRYGDKTARVKLVTSYIEAGRIWVPAKPPDFTKLRSYADLFLEEAALFSPGDTKKSKQTRDLVDTMTQVLIRLRDSGLLTHPTDIEAEPFYREERKLY